MYHDISCTPLPPPPPLKPCNIQLFGVASNSILNRACPLPYSLKDTSFYFCLSLANENLSHRFMNLQIIICLFDLREIDRLNIISLKLNHLPGCERNYENKGTINFKRAKYWTAHTTPESAVNTTDSCFTLTQIRLCQYLYMTGIFREI